MGFYVIYSMVEVFLWVFSWAYWIGPLFSLGSVPFIPRLALHYSSALLFQIGHEIAAELSSKLFAKLLTSLRLQRLHRIWHRRHRCQITMDIVDQWSGPLARNQPHLTAAPEQSAGRVKRRARGCAIPRPGFVWRGTQFTQRRVYLFGHPGRSRAEIVFRA